MNLMSKDTSSDSSQAGFVHILVLAGVLAAVGLLTSSAVLGESKGRTEEQNRVVEQQSEHQETQSEGKKQETETETPDGQKVKTKVEDNGDAKVEVEQEGLKLKYEVKDGKTKIEAEENGQKAGLNEEELKNTEDQVESGLEKEGIKIATGSGQPVIAKNQVAARVNFPLSVDIATNQLIVTTPAGRKVVTVLPDKAVQNLLETGVISKVENPSLGSEQAKDLGNLNGVVDLENRNNEMVYKVAGIKIQKLFGLIPVSVPTTAYVSAKTGNLVTQEQSVLANLIQLLSR